MPKNRNKLAEKIQNNQAAERERELLRLKQQLSAQNKALNEERELVQALRRELDVHRQVKLRGKAHKATKLPAASKPEATAFIVFSDWHGEETVHPDSVLGRNEYNMQICEQRAKAVTQRAIHLIHDSRNLATVRRVVVALLGDFIGGWIHPELEQTNSTSPTIALMRIGSILQSCLLTIGKESDCKDIEVVALPGNHGRTTKKTQAANRQKTSYEYVMYCHLAERLGDRFRWHSLTDEQGYQAIIKCGDHLIRCSHGDGVKFGGGVGGLHIPVNRRIARDNTWIDAHFDFFGHFHHWVQGDNFCCNGSIKGVDAYAAFRGFPYQEPLQTFALCDHRRGMVRVMKLYCD